MNSCMKSCGCFSLLYFICSKYLHCVHLLLQTPIITTVPPKMASFDFGDDPLNSGEPASVQCTILDGDYPVQVEWLLNGRSAEEIQDISIVKLGKRVTALTVDSVAGHHRGNYTCRVTNLAGRVEQTAQLFVNGWWEDLNVENVVHEFVSSF